MDLFLYFLVLSHLKLNTKSLIIETQLTQICHMGILYHFHCTLALYFFIRSYSKKNSQYQDEHFTVCSSRSYFCYDRINK